MVSYKKYVIAIFILFLCPFASCKESRALSEEAFSPCTISIIGTGYVGLIGGAGLSKMGHNVICADIDKRKIKMLNDGQMPIYEPGLEEMVKKNFAQGRLFFTDDVGAAIRNSDVVIVAVGTPMDDDGRANLAYLESAMKTIGQNLNGYKVICIKSTVPVGTNKKMKLFLKEHAVKGCGFDIVSNPEFLRAGNALKDFFKDNPIVIGSDSEQALDIMENLYSPLKKGGTAFIRTNLETAETIKYSWNSLVAVKVGYINELSRFCNACGADIEKIKEAIAFEDKILPFKKVNPGPGFGGSCLPKDTRAFIRRAQELGVDMQMIKGILASNQIQKQEAVKQLYNLLGGSFAGKTIGILGLSFKANTDDIRKSPAIDTIRKLQADGATIKAYDPQATENMRRLFPNVNYCNSVDQAIKNVDALIILTDWASIKNADLTTLAKKMKNPVVVDAKNIFDPKDLEANGLSFANFGRR